MIADILEEVSSETQNKVLIDGLLQLVSSGSCPICAGIGHGTTPSMKCPLVVRVIKIANACAPQLSMILSIKLKRKITTYLRDLKCQQRTQKNKADHASDAQIGESPRKKRHTDKIVSGLTLQLK